jgi:predicted dehydrogenase
VSVRIGLLGATGIAERAIVGPAADRPGVLVAAVAAHDVERARRFAARHGVAVVHERYEDVLDDPSVDAVYISLHHSAHARWARAAAAAGKHVLVEKPLCLTPQEAAGIERAAATSGVRVVEMVMTAGHEWQSRVRDLVTGGRFGRLRGIRSRMRFEVAAGSGFRLRPELGGGAFYDTASYWLQAVQATAGIGGAVASGVSDFDGPNGVDRSFRARLDLPNAVTAVLECAFGTGHLAEHEFAFEQADVRVPKVLLPAIGLAVPLNIVIRPHTGSRTVVACAPVDYYRVQFARVLQLLAGAPGEWGAGIDEATARVRLMAAAHRDAVERQSPSTDRNPNALL